MKTRILQIRTALFLLLICISGVLTAQNMNSYITIDVQSGQDISISFTAHYDNTPVRIVAGEQEHNLLIGSEWTVHEQNDLNATKIFIYGNIKGINCEGNGEKIYGIDVNHNMNLQILKCANNNISTLNVGQDTALQILECYNNSFTTEELNNLFCSLPNRTGFTKGTVYVLNNTSDGNHENVLATNSLNAINKNWDLMYFETQSYIPETSGDFICETPIDPNEKYISLMVESGQNIKLNLASDTPNTLAKVISGTQEYDVTIGTSWTGVEEYTSEGETMIVYGNITQFDCSNNDQNITSINTRQNGNLRTLICSDNQIDNLDLSLNMLLTELNCANNKIEKLDLSQDTALVELNIYNNLFSTADLDTLFCSLPDRTNFEQGYIYPLYNNSDINQATVLASNSQNAINKNWEIKYNESQINIPETTGEYVCSEVSVTGVTVTPTMDTIDLNSTCQLSVACQPINATNRNVIWSSDNENIATVDDNGLVTGISLGNTIIKATTEDGNFIAGCGINVKNTSEITNIKLTQNLNIYPNPLKDELNIEVQENLRNVKIYNLQGQLIVEHKDKKNISISNLPAGVYIIKITTDAQTYSKKIMKE